MTKRKKLIELTDKAVIRKLFPREVVEEARRVARDSEKRARTAPKKKKPKDLS